MAHTWAPLTFDGSNPVPGDPDVVRDGARRYLSVAESISAAAANLRAMLADECYASHAVDAVRTKAHQVADDISRAHDRYQAAGAALTAYVGVLDGQQAAAEGLRTRAVHAFDAYHDAEANVRWASSRMDAAVDEADRQQWLSRVRHYEDEREDARDALAGARSDLEPVVAAVDAAARAAAGQIQDVVSSDGLRDSVWQNIAGFVHGLSGAMDVIATVAGIAALVTMFIPGVGELFALVALCATAVKLLADVLIKANEGGSWDDIIWDVVGIASFGAGKGLTSMARGATTAAKGATRVAAGRLAAGGKEIGFFRGPLGGVSGSEGTLNKWAGEAIASISRTRVTGMLRQGTNLLRRGVTDGLRSYTPKAIGESLAPLKNVPGALDDVAAGVRSVVGDVTTIGAVRGVPNAVLRLMGEPDGAANVSALLHANPEMLTRMGSTVLNRAGTTLTNELSRAAASVGGAVAFNIEEGARTIADAMPHSDPPAPHTPAERLNLSR